MTTSALPAATTASLSVAARIVQPAAETSALQVLTFGLGTEYGFDLLAVQEIRSYEQPTRMAGTPPWVRGVLNLRGIVVPVLDLREKLGLEPMPYGASTVTVVLQVGHQALGVVVDAVHDVALLERQQLQRAPVAGSAAAAYVAGIATLQLEGTARTLILLDASRLVAGSVALH